MDQLRRQIAGMLVMGFSGCEVDSTSPIVTGLKEGLGGVLLFDSDLATKAPHKNLKNLTQIKRLTRELRYQATQSTELPLFIAVDYEGGAVDRLSHIKGCMSTMTPEQQALLSDKALYAEATKMAKTLSELGFNLNFAPVIDLNLHQNQGIIGARGRSFSKDPVQVIRAAKQFVTAFSQQGIVCSYKHFPGHGSALGDTHDGFVDVTEGYQASELVPYQRLLNDHTLPRTMVMTAHVIHRGWDELPATLSHPIITGILRQQIGFDGVVISDDLQMQAISAHYLLDEALCLTINAGADMVIIANQLGEITASEVIDIVVGLVTSGAIDRARIEQAYQRIVTLKTINAPTKIVDAKGVFDPIF